MKVALPAWIRPGKTESIFNVAILVQPGASKTEVVGVVQCGGQDNAQERLKIRLAAAPVEGAANEALISFFKKRYGKLAPGSKVSFLLTKGNASRQKEVQIQGWTLQQVIQYLVLHD